MSRHFFGSSPVADPSAVESYPLPETVEVV